MEDWPEINWKAFVFLFSVAQVILPAQIDYFFHTVPTQLKTFTFEDGLWNLIYVETMLVMFALCGTAMVYFYEYLVLNAHKVYKPD
jgi:hypothetical protein